MTSLNLEPGHINIEIRFTNCRKCIKNCIIIVAINKYLAIMRLGMGITVLFVYLLSGGNRKQCFVDGMTIIQRHTLN